MNFKEIRILRKAYYGWLNLLNRYTYRYGKNNIIENRGGIKINSRVQIVGNGNKVVIEKDALLMNSLIKISGNNNLVWLKANSYLSGVELWIENNECEISVGERTFIGHHSHLACTENGSKLSIGCDGMISSYVQIRTGDSHSIVDMRGNRINFAKSVFIGDHCWLGEGVKVLKGVTLEGDDVVSTGAIVTKSFGRNVLLGGVPAKVIKEFINWNCERL